ncbi:fimbrial protein [Serratia sp. JSRIV001]|uniref:fimbrial protein n=1 Tax=Serratia sp. JSRIV001 TaxID=2831893 RepID=UPI001CBB5AC6|nr:fimbrial protein [Serratia sp. JSRIV001]UAN45367.1 fimbrial protein [Serratia sp. JSRIV001]
MPNGRGRDKCTIKADYPIRVQLITAIWKVKMICNGGGMLLVLGSVLLLTSVLAYSEEQLIAVNVKVTVIAAPSCVTNNGNMLIVDFGSDIVTKKVDGKNYKRPIPFNLYCSGLASNALKFQLQGTRASFGDENILSTNNQNLGIAIEYHTLSIPLNQDLNFNYPYIPALDAVLVKRPGSTLSGGRFTAGITLSVNYQ